MKCYEVNEFKSKIETFSSGTGRREKAREHQKSYLELVGRVCMYLCFEAMMRIVGLLEGLNLRFRESGISRYRDMLLQFADLGSDIPRAERAGKY